MNMLVKKILVSLHFLFVALFVVACGGGGDGSVAGGGIGGTGISGTITGFGSIKLNGFEIDTTNATREVDGVVDISTGSDDNKVLGVGMVVTIIGTLNDDGVTGTATMIKYDDDVQGPLQGPITEVDQTKTFSVMGIPVSVNRISTVFENTDYSSLLGGDLVEVSGYYDGAGTLHATRIENKGGTEIEVKGTVVRFVGLASYELAVKYGAVFTVENSPVIFPPLEVGDFVEVKGTLAGTTITASDLERESEGFDEDIEKASIEGIVTGFNGLADFQLAGQQVDAGAASFSPASLQASLADGMEVEVEGDLVNGVLQASKVEARGGNVEIGARVLSVTPDVGATTGSVALQLFPGSLTVLVDSQTLLRDDTDRVDSLTLDDLAAMDYLEVEAYSDDSGNLVATEIRRDEVDDDLLQGPVDSCDGVTVSILGLGFALDDDITSYADEGDVDIATAAEFCKQQQSKGLLVKVVDKLSGIGPDGTADEAELED